MSYPGTGGPRKIDGPLGHTYGAVLVRRGVVDDVLPALRGMRFSGWVCPPDAGWLPVVLSHRTVTAASARRGVIGVAAELAGGLRAATGADGGELSPSPMIVIGLRVVDDRQLLLVVWQGGVEVGRYLSDPSYGLGDDTLPMPYGVEHAYAFAEALGEPGKGEKLAELLGEELDPDHMIESERLKRVLTLLGLPVWLVASSSLPRDVPTGPSRAEVTRLGAGLTGPAGLLAGRAVDVVRARRPPPPAVTDAPRGVDIDPWLM